MTARDVLVLRNFCFTIIALLAIRTGFLYYRFETESAATLKQARHTAAELEKLLARAAK